MTTTAADRATFGYALADEEGEAFWLTGMLQTVKIGSADRVGGRRGAPKVWPIRRSISNPSHRSAF